MRNNLFMNSTAIALACVPTTAFAQAQATPAQGAPASTQPPSAPPQDRSAPEQRGLEEIIVTANRQAQNLQRTPIAVTAVTGALIESKSVAKPEDLNRVAPSLQVTQGTGAFSNFNLRGISSFTTNSFSDAAISINYDGVPIGRPTGSRGFYFDLDRVEVLKGPQGTLYGRNASAGVINFIPRSARLGVFEANLLAEYGNYDLTRLQGAVNVPVTDTLAARVAFQSARHDGYMSDGTYDQDDQGIRLKMLWAPVDGLRLDLGLDYARDGGRGSVMTYFLRQGRDLSPLGGDAWAGPQDPAVLQLVSSFRAPRPFDNSLNDEWWGANLRVDADTPLGTITVIPAYRRTRLDTRGETGGLDIAFKGTEEQKSIEARLASENDHPLRYLIGGFYFDEQYSHQPIFDLGSQIQAQQNSLSNKAWAVFGRLTWAITDTFRLTGGARFTHEDRAVDAVVNTQFFFPILVTVPPSPSRDSTSFEKVTWRAAAEWDVTPSNFLYGSVETGFKAGGFYTVPVSTSTPTGASIFQPETITAFTLGSKNRFLGNRLQLNVEAFYYLFDNQQFTHRTAFPVAGSTTGLLINPTDNMGLQKIRGVEVSTEFLLTENTRLTGTIQYLDGKLGSFSYTSLTPVTGGSLCRDLGLDPTPNVRRFLVDCTNNPLINAPKWTGMAGVQQTFPLSSGASIVAEASTYFRTGMWTSQEYLPAQRVPGYASVDASIGYHAPDDRWSIEAWVRNLTDKLVLNNPLRDILSSFTNSNTTLWTSTILPPRTYGVRLRAKFGS